MKLRRVYSTPNVDSAQRVLQAARGAGSTTMRFH